MHETDDGKLILSRREFNTVLSHGAGGGILSGWFDDEDEGYGGPGLLDDFEIRDKDGHVITDPETIEFLGEALEVTRPNAYDEGVRISVSGDVAVKDQDINPKSIGKDDPAESVHTDRAGINGTIRQNWPVNSGNLLTGIRDGFVPLDSSTFYSPSGTKDWAGRPDIIELANGNWMLLYRQDDAHNPSSDSEINIRFSDDEGRSWTADNTTLDGSSISTFPLNPSENIYDAIFVEAANGDLLLLAGTESGNLTGTLQLRSTDGGGTWTNEGKISVSGAPYIDDAIGVSMDKLRLDDGTIYVSAFVDPGLTGPPFEAGLLKTEDAGGSWDWVSQITDAATHGNYNESGIAHLGNNEFIAVIRDGSGSATGFRRSTDGGQNWSPLEDISGEIGVIHRPRLYSLGSISKWMDDASGPVLLTGRSTTIGDPMLAASLTGGRSWTPVQSISGGADNGYSTLALRDNGEIYHQTYAGSSKDEADLIESVFVPYSREATTVVSKTTSSKTVLNEDDTVMEFDSVIAGNDYLWDTSTHEFTAPLDGTYQIDARVKIARSTTSLPIGVFMFLIESGNRRISQSDYAAKGSLAADPWARYRGEFIMDKGDSIQFGVYQSTGSSLDVASDTTITVSFSSDQS